jgi:hypothetical protein
VQQLDMQPPHMGQVFGPGIETVDSAAAIRFGFIRVRWCSIRARDHTGTGGFLNNLCQIFCPVPLNRHDPLIHNVNELKNCRTSLTVGQTV